MSNATVHSDSETLAAVKYILENASRGSEWREAATLQKVSEVIYGSWSNDLTTRQPADLSKENLDAMLAEIDEEP